MNTNKQHILCASFTILCAVSFPAFGTPRSPLPPLPEVAPRLHHLSFDEVISSGPNRDASISTDYGVVTESWSGFALQRSGNSVPPFIVPALDAGRTNIACTAGAI